GRLRAILLLVPLVSLAGQAVAETPGPSIEFNRDIRPILADHCFACHGPDAAKRKAKLRLDTEEGARADLGGRRAIVSGDLDESELAGRIPPDDERERMPPAGTGRPLTSEQIEALRRWVAEGAAWQPHWSLIPPRRPPPPAVREEAWPRNPIDRF